MFPDDRHLPETILEVLAKQGAKRIPRGIARLDPGRLPDSPAQSPQTEVQLIVLISHQPGIKQPDPRKDPPRPAPKVHGVNLSFEFPVIGFSATSTERRFECCRVGLSQNPPTFGHPRTAHVIRSGLPQ